MKYIELKQSLKQGIKNAYLIFGDDRYLCYDALKKSEPSVQKNTSTLDGKGLFK